MIYRERHRVWLLGDSVGVLMVFASRVAFFCSDAMNERIQSGALLTVNDLSDSFLSLSCCGLF
jgi:hypothetical protein